MKKNLKTILSIAGVDPCGGAGIQADIKAAGALGVHVLSAVTAVTVQNSKEFSSMNPVYTEVLQQQLQSIIEDVTPDIVKIGIIGNLEQFDIISSFLKALSSRIKVVVDPILGTTVKPGTMISGNSLDHKSLINKMIQAYKEKIFPYSTVITPNIKEVALLSGQNLINIVDCTRIPQILKVKNLIITGWKNQEKFIDLLVEENKLFTNSHSIIECKNLHGTGCVFSSLLASYLALGEDLKNSFIKASDRLNLIIRNSCDYSLGLSTYGPLNIINFNL